MWWFLYQKAVYSSNVYRYVLKSFREGNFMDWLFKNENHICSLRVAGVIVHNNCLLVQREKGNYVYAIPGGHVRIGETLADALIREYSEEMNFSIYPTRLLWTEECFWSWS